MSDKRHIIVGRDAPTESKARAMAEERFGTDNVLRGEKTLHTKDCPEYLAPIVGVGSCDCPRVTVFSNARALPGLGDSAER